VSREDVNKMLMQNDSGLDQNEYRKLKIKIADLTTGEESLRLDLNKLEEDSKRNMAVTL
jgi:hypothetical protein